MGTEPCCWCPTSAVVTTDLGAVGRLCCPIERGEGVGRDNLDSR